MAPMRDLWGVAEQQKRQRADWSDLRVFLAVAESGGFGAAGRALGIQQSTVTRRIEDLEIRLGAKLCHRRTDGVELTEAGRAIYNHALTMHRSAEAIEDLVVDAERKAEGHVNISLPDGVGTYWVAPHLGDFMRANPKIALSLDCGIWPDHPVTGGNEVSLQFDKPADASLVATPVATFHYCLYAAPEYLETYGAPKSLSDVGGHRYVHLSAYGRVKEGYGPKTEAFLGLMDRQLETNCSSVLVSAVRAGAGIAALPTAIATVAPELICLDIAPITHPVLWLCIPRAVQRSARIRQVGEWVQTLFSGETQPWFRAEFIRPSEFGLIRRAS